MLVVSIGQNVFHYEAMKLYEEKLVLNLLIFVVRIKYVFGFRLCRALS